MSYEYTTDEWFSPLGAENFSTGTFVVINTDGQNQRMDHVCQGWWNEGYLGRVIRCTKVDDSSNQRLELFFLTTSTKKTIGSKIPDFFVIWLEDSEMEEFFDFVRIGDIIEIK
jgi:hypothetical protein